MSIISSKAERLYPTLTIDSTHDALAQVYTSDDLQEAYLRGRNAPPADAEIEAVAKRLLWNSCKRYDDEYAAKDEEEAWDREGCFPGWQEDYIRQAKELLALARKAVNE